MMQGESGCKKAGRRPNRPPDGFGGRSPPAPAEPGRPAARIRGHLQGGKGQRRVPFRVQWGQGAEKLQKGQRSPGKSLRHKPRRVALDECLVEIDGKGQLINADVFIFPVHRGILLPVDINGGKTVGIGYCPKRCGYRYIYSGFRWKPCCCGATLEPE